MAQSRRFVCFYIIFYEAVGVRDAESRLSNIHHHLLCRKPQAYDSRFDIHHAAQILTDYGNILLCGDIYTIWKYVEMNENNKCTCWTTLMESTYSYTRYFFAPKRWVCNTCIPLKTVFLDINNLQFSYSLKVRSCNILRTYYVNILGTYAYLSFLLNKLFLRQRQNHHQMWEADYNCIRRIANLFECKINDNRISQEISAMCIDIRNEFIVFFKNLVTVWSISVQVIHGY